VVPLSPPSSELPQPATATAASTTGTKTNPNAFLHLINIPLV
jgi:hypothetical protein